MAPAASIPIAAVAGLALGSFAVTAAIRSSRGQSVLVGRSRCDHCGLGLGYAQTAPVLSFWRLGGACSGCGGRIDRVHLVGEIAGALILVGAALTGDLARGAALAVLGLLLITASAFDWKTQRLPDGLTLAVAALTLGLAATGGEGALARGLLAAAVAAAILQALRWTSARRGGDPGLGLGDVKLIASLALWLGPLTPWAVVVAAIGGLIMMRTVSPADGRLAFGPAIAAGGWIIGMGAEWGWWPTTV